MTTISEQFSQPGPWHPAADRTSCAMCGGVTEPGGKVRHHPDAGGLVCSVCGQPEEDEQPDGHSGSGSPRQPQNRPPLRPPKRLGRGNSPSMRCRLGLYGDITIFSVQFMC